MKKLSPEYISSALKCKFFKNSDELVSSVFIDSRKVTNGGIFFCIIGNVNDAHKFIPDVQKSGCKNIVISDINWANKLIDEGRANIYLVEDTTRALMDLATKYFADWKNIIKIGVTGSDGKTSTKEFLYSALSSKYRVGKTKGNFNSEYGVPLTIFDFEEDIEAAVIEMGVGDTTRMGDLRNIVDPDGAIITNIGTSHLETFKTRENLAIEKLKIAEGFDKKNPLVINSDNDILGSEKLLSLINGDPDIIKVGTKNNSSYKIYDIKDLGIDGIKCKLRFSDDIIEKMKKAGKTSNNSSEVAELNLRAIGRHNLLNATEALALAVGIGVPLCDAIEGINKTDININEKRLDIIRATDWTIINDTYNASPESMIAGIDVLINSKASRYVSILGDMLELGQNSEEGHIIVGKYLACKGVDLLITVGERARDIARGARENGIRHIIEYKDLDEAKGNIRRNICKGDLILIKASRGMMLENIAEELKCI